MATFFLLLNMASEAEDNRSQRRSRSRIIQACILCHRLKRKCNRKRPCSQCLNRQTSNCAYKALTAEYLESLENDTISLDVENKILQSRISQLEALISQLRNQSKDPADLRTDWKGEGPRKWSTIKTSYFNFYGRSFYLGGPAAPNLFIG
ncbi:hypothetical protein V1519DRAFT_453861 [Lipomyces tetrasporus]